MRKLFERIKGWFFKPDAYLAELVNSHRQALLTIAGLNWAIGELQNKVQAENYEKLVLLGSLAMQSGGRIVWSRAFIETVERGQYQVKIGPSDDKKDIVVEIISVEQEKPAQTEAEFENDISKEA